MRNHRLLSLALCLALCGILLAGCSIMPAPVPAPAEASRETASPAAQPAAPEETEPAAEQPSVQEPAAAEASPAPTPEPTPEPVQEIRLSGGSYPKDTRELTAVVTAEDLPLLEGFAELKKADFRGSACQKELVDWALAHPEVSVRCDVTLSDGTKLDADTKELSLPDTVPGEDLLTLVLLPDLRSVELGACEDAAESPLDWEALARAEAACPQAEFHYAFRLYHKEFDLQSTEMDLNHITMDDEGALVKKVAACLPDLALLDMDFCEVSDEAMAGIRDSLPETEVIWRIWFGKGRQGGYTARTNAIKILASNPDWAGELTPENTACLQYCTKVKYLDLGHNNLLTDISFVRSMPDLEVVILAMSGVKDLRPLADCPKLEYLEIQTSAISDLRPLATCKNLRHLNIAFNFTVTDITPLYELTDLERLWIGALDPVPREQVAEMQRRAPNCQIDLESRDPTGGDWRYTSFDEWGGAQLHPRYALLREQFDYGSNPWCYNYIESDPLYYPHG